MDIEVVLENAVSVRLFAAPAVVLLTIFICVPDKFAYKVPAENVNALEAIWAI